MAIIKLVCQGCGANLDALDDRRVVQCGYCGTSNQIRQTVHAQPQPQPQPPPQPVAPPPPPIQYSYAPQPLQVSEPQRSGAGRAIALMIFGIALVPLLIGGVIIYLVTGVAGDAIERFGAAIENATTMKQNYMWVSARPYLADVDGDGNDDVLGLVQPFGGQQVELVATSGSNFSPLWKIELGRRADLPTPVLRYDADAKLLLFEIGPALHAYDASTGAQRWVASLPDKIAMVARDGEQLWVATIDEQQHNVGLADGKVTSGAAKLGPQAKQLRDDGEYDLIPDLRELDLRYDQFADVRVQQAFCAEADLPIHTGRRHDEDAKRCANPNGLAWVSRDKGTQVPFLIGYARADLSKSPRSPADAGPSREDKAERWRVQLTKAGSLETIDTGFAQPRAEIFGDQAIVSFAPSSDNHARIRRISLTDGSTQWETTLARKNTEHVNGMTVGNNRVAVQYGQALVVLDLADGRQLASLGGL